MGCYVDDPPAPGATVSRRRENWLDEHGSEIPGPPAWDEIPVGTAAVCLIDNGPWKAAGIAFDEVELRRFVAGRDGRSWRWFFVPKSQLYTVSALAAYEEAKEQP